MINVLGASQRMLESQTEFPSREAAFEYLRGLRRRDAEATLRHRLEHNLTPAGAGWTVKYDKVRVALGLAHMEDDLRKYAAKTTCPVAILRGSHGSELTLEDAKSVAGCWKNATVIDVEGDYTLQMENPAGSPRLSWDGRKDSYDGRDRRRPATGGMAPARGASSSRPGS